jgi:putative colanic acid biosynthesis UDP-glucose lipid carrier transferase
MSWLTPLVALLIKRESKGPVFFKQLRNGKNYKPFVCYKFRSMRMNDEADKKLVSANDDRITRIGKWLRKTSIDEMPQFFNVLKGDMSVVGPRPHMIAANEEYKKRVKRFMGRHYIKPGITGLAQVKGYRGDTSTDESLINRIKYDMYYIKNWSLFLDIKIIIQTVMNVFIKGDKNAI